MERQDIKVSVGRTITIDLRYEVDVNLRIYTLPLHFTPSAKNSNT
ncbi:MAG TPA: hypothetical protein VFQ24_06480 [Terriglobia bacterium]|nr:hypothetical protein [Terriglobia bacterium]